MCFYWIKDCNTPKFPKEISSLETLRNKKQTNKRELWILIQLAPIQILQNDYKADLLIGIYRLPRSQIYLHRQFCFYCPHRSNPEGRHCLMQRPQYNSSAKLTCDVPKPLMYVGEICVCLVPRSPTLLYLASLHHTFFHISSGLNAPISHQLTAWFITIHPYKFF